LDDESLTVDIIKEFNILLEKEEYQEISTLLLKEKENTFFKVTCFDGEEKDTLKMNVSNLKWATSFKLFKHVFAKDSKYMTVHQAKGLEWEKVVVSVAPTRRSKADFTKMFIDPQITDETERDEFTRLFYVACSRAENELYIHLKNRSSEAKVIKERLQRYCEENGLENFFTFW